MRTRQTEFGGHGHTVPEWVQILVGGGFLKDTSWCNDAMPSFDVVNGGDEEAGVRLCVDHLKPEERECGKTVPRFMIFTGDLGDVPEYHGDDQQEISDCLLISDRDDNSKTYHVRLVGADKKIVAGMATEAEAMEWIREFVKTNSKEV